MFLFINGVLAMSQPSGQQGSGSGGFISMLIMFGLIILVMYFLMIRPQQKRQKEHQKMLESIKKGDKVVTSSGIHGTVTDLDDKTYEIQISDNVRVRFERSAVAAKK